MNAWGHTYGVDLTGKPRDLAFACYQYKVNVGDCQGHAYAVIEKFFGLLKSELLYLQEFQSTEQFVEYLDYYNNRRIKAKRKDLPPAIHGQQARLAAWAIFAINICLTFWGHFKDKRMSSFVHFGSAGYDCSALDLHEIV